MGNQVTLVEGIPEDISTLFPSHCRPGIIVLDDLMRNCSGDERILDLFTKVSHHCDVTCIYLTQTSFHLESFPAAFLSMPTTLLRLITLAIHWDSGHWHNKPLRDKCLTYGRVFKMPLRNPMVISCWICIREHQLLYDYVATYCLCPKRIPWFTSTRKPIKRMTHWQWDCS